MRKIDKTRVELLRFVLGYGGLQCAGPEQLIVRSDLTLLDARLEQKLCHAELLVRRLLILERAYVGKAQAARIVARHVCAHLIPATSYVDIAIAANEKIDRDIVALLRLNVECLQEAHTEHTRRLRRTVIRVGGQHDDHRHGRGEGGQGSQRRLRKPHGTRHVAQYQAATDVVLICKGKRSEMFR